MNRREANYICYFENGRSPLSRRGELLTHQVRQREAINRTDVQPKMWSCSD